MRDAAFGVNDTAVFFVGRTNAHNSHTGTTRVRVKNWTVMRQQDVREVEISTLPIPQPGCLAAACLCASGAGLLRRDKRAAAGFRSYSCFPPRALSNPENFGR